MTPERLKHGQDFLDAINKAMEHVDDVVATVNEYGENHDYPPLAASYTSRKDAIDVEKMKKMEDLVYFMTRALFGRDCDNDSVVAFSMVHLGSHEDFLPFWRVKRVDDWDDPLEARLRNVELVQNILDNVKEKLRFKKKGIEEDVKKIIRKDARLTAAKDCPNCRGKGWEDAGKQESTSYKVYCENWGIGAKRDGPYRFPCECQSERDLCGWPLKDNE
jgi:hypothetical protein